MKSFLSFIRTPVNESFSPNGENIDHYHEKPNTRKGSNPGGLFKNPDTGEDHYVKFYHNHEQARSEVAAAGIYGMLGAKTVNPRLVNRGGKIGVASKWNGELKSMEQADFHDLGDEDKHQIGKHFMGAVLTKNWDAVGLDHDNIMKHKYSDEYHTVDLGGTFEHRAQGAHKPYGPDVKEFHTLRDPDMNPQSHDVFGQLGPEHIESAKQSLHQVTPDKVHSLFNSVGINNPAQKTAALIARKSALFEA